MTLEENLDDILSDMEDMETEEKKQHERQHQIGKGDRDVVEKDERQYWGEKQFIKSPADVPVVKKKKRKPSKYNIFIGECMHGGKDMKTCAAEYKSHRNRGVDDGGDEKEKKNEEEFMCIFTSDGCPACGEAKIKLREKLDGGEIVELNVTKDEEANKLYQLLGANTKGTPSFVAFTKNSICLLNDDFEEESCVVIEKEKEKMKS